jgi:hypothetical protein
MLGKKLAVTLLAVSALAMASADTKTTPVAKLSAAEIADKNAAARGGLQAWRNVKTITLSGKMDAGGNQRPTLTMPGVKRGTKLPTRAIDEVQLPFKMEMERPRKQRIELEFGGKTAVQVYDGTNGWKLRPFLNRNEVEPFTSDELKIAASQSELDGPLIDYATKGTKIDLDGMEKIDGKDTYKLKLTMKSGQTMNIWIDAQTFLEVKMEGTPRRLDGKSHQVEVYLKDFRSTDGLMIPRLLETKVLPLKSDKPVMTKRNLIEKILIENVVVNPKLEETLISNPEVQAGVSTNAASAVRGHSLP